MRGRRDPQDVMFVVADLDAMVPDDHPLRAIKRRADEELRRLRPHFEAAYARTDRPSIPPEDHRPAAPVSCGSPSRHGTIKS